MSPAPPARIGSESKPMHTVRMIAPPAFDEHNLVTLVDRLVRVIPGAMGSKARVIQLTQMRESLAGGYDGLVSSVVPFFIQAKTAEFHPAASASEIISGRATLRLTTNPGAFAFSLRRHRKTTEPLQHNALYWLSLRTTAAYVVPTFRTEKALEEHLDRALNVVRSQVWKYKASTYSEAKRSSFDLTVRHFHGLVSIVPHRLVSDTPHRYSYNIDEPIQVGFHSDPEPAKGESFEKFIAGVISKLENDGNDIVRVDRRSAVDHFEWLVSAMDAEELKLPREALGLAMINAGITDVLRRDPDKALRLLQGKSWLDVAAVLGALFWTEFGIRQHLAYLAVN